MKTTKNAPEATSALEAARSSVEQARTRVEDERRTLEQLRSEHATASAQHRADIAIGLDTDDQESRVRQLERDCRRSAIRLAAREAEFDQAVSVSRGAEDEVILGEMRELRSRIAAQGRKFERLQREAAVAAGEGRRQLAALSSLRDRLHDPTRAREVDVEDVAEDRAGLQAFLRFIGPGLSRHRIENIRSTSDALFDSSTRPFGPDGNASVDAAKGSAAA